MEEAEFSPVSSKAEVAALLETMMQPGAAQIRLNVGGAEPFPIVILDLEEDDFVSYDLTAIRDLAPKLRRGVEFILLGQNHAGIIRSTPMKMRDFVDKDGRLHCKSDWPKGLDLRQRRAAFRAQLRIGMDVGVRLRTDDEDESKRLELMGDLRDLSATGCLVEFFSQDGASKVLNEMKAELELCFPDSTVFPIVSNVRHIKTDADRQVLTVGFEFDNPSQEKEKQLWNFVREIEREASRSAGDGGNRTPSPLFEQKGDNPIALGRRQGHKYATPIARRLARIAGYLDSQMVALRQSQEVNSVQLSAHADRLLDLLKDDREGTLFALRCIHRESPWVMHGLGLAIRMADLAQSRAKIPRDLLKAIVACGMIHDLGKGMLPSSLWKASTLSRDSYVRMQSHVALLVNQMGKCKWLAPIVVQGVIERINERLDGSGYPLGLKATDLGELTRMAMIVDTVDAMSRPRVDRAGMTPEQMYRFLLTNTDMYDRNWIEAYIRHFGVIPVGTLIKYKSGQLAWVISLDDKRFIQAVQLTDHAGPPDAKLGEIVEGEKLAALGEIREVIGAEY